MLDEKLLKAVANCKTKEHFACVEILKRAVKDSLWLTVTDYCDALKAGNGDIDKSE